MIQGYYKTLGLRSRAKAPVLQPGVSLPDVWDVVVAIVQGWMTDHDVSLELMD